MNHSEVYDYVFVTHLPAFYKVNLYNELAKKIKIFVIFVGEQSSGRNQDFVPSDFHFPHLYLNQGQFENRNVFFSLIKIQRTISRLEYRGLCLNGWDLIEFWFAALLSPKCQNILVLESTSYESYTLGFRGLLKRFFLGRTQQVFASSQSAQKLLEKLYYRKKTVITHGVGLIHKMSAHAQQTRGYQRRFTFIGRLVTVKNLEYVIRTFNDLPEHQLHIIGDGPLEKHLKEIANQNIKFSRHIPNLELNTAFAQSDFLLLVSKSETWGLVVEEALQQRVPVIVSENCGVAELVSNGINGFIIDLNQKDSLKKAIMSVDEEGYQRMVATLRSDYIEQKDLKQIEAYLFNIPEALKT